MFVTITSLQLKSFLGFFKLSWLGLKISLQAKKEVGFVTMKNTGFGKLHYTISQWRTEEDLKRFAHSGEHLKALKESGKLAYKIYTYTYASEKLPDWSQAKKLVVEKGKPLIFH